MGAKHVGAHGARRSGRIALFPVIVVCVALLACGIIGWCVVTVSSSDSFDESTLRTADAQESSATSSLVPAPQLSPFAALFASGEVGSIRLVGDSITAGYGTDGYYDADVSGQGNVIYDDGAQTVHYEASLEANDWANAFRRWAYEHGIEDFVNAGINGSMMMELAADPDAWLADGADVIVIALGTNDAGYYGAEEYADAARTAIAAAAQKSKLVVAISPVSDLRPTEGLVEPAASLKDALRQVCEETGSLFVDGSAAVTPDQFCDDGLHPNTEGSLGIWECVRSSLGIAEA